MARVRKSKVESVAEQIASFSADEVERLQRILLPGLPTRPEGGHNVMELKGLGKEFWRSIDVDAYLEGERNSWRS